MGTVAEHAQKVTMHMDEYCLKRNPVLKLLPGPGNILTHPALSAAGSKPKH